MEETAEAKTADPKKRPQKRDLPQTQIRLSEATAKQVAELQEYYSLPSVNATFAVAIRIAHDLMTKGPSTATAPTKKEVAKAGKIEAGK